MLTAKKVEEKLRREGLRQYIDAIEDNPATPGEVVLWRGCGKPIYSMKQALNYALDCKAEDDAN